MKLISPRRTLTSWGSSSRFQRRSTRPTRVTRGSPALVMRGPGSELILIVRNFRMSNGLPRSPTRAWRKRIGPGPLQRTASATAASKGLSTRTKMPAATASKPRLSWSYLIRARESVMQRRTSVCAPAARWRGRPRSRVPRRRRSYPGRSAARRAVATPGRPPGTLPRGTRSGRRSRLHVRRAPGNARPDTAGREHANELVTVDRQAVEVEADRVEVPGVPAVRLLVRSLDLLEIVELRGVAQRDCRAPRPEAVGPGELPEPEGGREEIGRA